MNEITKWIPVVAWLLSLLAVPLFPEAVYVVIATSVNLLHWRWTLYNSGQEFTRRVRNTLAEDIRVWEARLHGVEKTVVDVKEAQVGIAGAFRGRQHP